MNSLKPSFKKRRIAVTELDSLIEQLKAAGTSITNDLDILSMDSNELLALCNTHNIPLSYQKVQSLKKRIAYAFLPERLGKLDSSSLPNLLSPSPQDPLPRQIFFGNPELESLFPSLPHPSFLELQEDRPEGPHANSPLRLSHHVGMTLAVASAAQGAKVLLLDTGVGTELEQLIMQKCTAFCQTYRYTSDYAVEQLLDRVTVQRCYDPFSLLTALASLSALPVQSQPDIIIVMDWMKLTLPFMTELDIQLHRRQFGEYAIDAGGRGKGGNSSESKVSLRPLLAEAMLSLQSLTVPRVYSDLVSEVEQEVPAAIVKNQKMKATSVVILNALFHTAQVHDTSGLSADCENQTPFGTLLMDAVDYSVRLREEGGTQLMGEACIRSHTAVVQKSPEMAINLKNTQRPFCSFSI